MSAADRVQTRESYRLGLELSEYVCSSGVSASLPLLTRSRPSMADAVVRPHLPGSKPNMQVEEAEVTLRDAFVGLLGGSGTRTVPVALQPGETEMAREVASLRPGELSSVGGDLVVTNRRVVFTPLDTRDVVQVLTWALGKAGAPGPLAGIPGQLGKLMGPEQPGGPAGLEGIGGVAVGSAPSILRPPTLLIVDLQGRTTEIGILASRRSPNPSRQNAVARDRILEVIRRQLST